MIIDEKVIKVAELITRVQELEKELAKKESIINRWQLEEYFKTNYPENSQ